jgi:hypothetical protein
MVVLGTASPASATTGSQTYQYDCTLSSPLGNQVMPLALTFAGTATDSPTDLASPDEVSHTGDVDYSVTVAATISGDVLTAAQAQVGAFVPGATITGVALTMDSISTSVTNASPAAGSSFSASAPLVGTSVPPNFTSGNTFTFPNAISGAANVSGYTEGGLANDVEFSGGPATISVTLTINPIGPNALTGVSCTINNQDTVLDAGEAQVPPTPPSTTPTGIPLVTGLAPPTADYATVAMVNAAPVLDNDDPLTAVAALTQNLTISGDDADGDDLESFAVSDATCTDALASVVPLGAVGSTTSSATYSFVAPANDANYTCTFDADVDDDEGKAAETAQFTINVTAGDQTTQDVSLQLDPGVLDLEGEGTIDLGTYTLEGVDFTTDDAAINQLTIADGRGVPAPCTLTAELQGDLTNDLYTGDPNGVIARDHLHMSGIECARTAIGGVGDDPTAGTGGTLDGPVTMCTADPTQNTGQFTADAILNLDVPGSSYSGLYTATIEFIVS